MGQFPQWLAMNCSKEPEKGHSGALHLTCRSDIRATAMRSGCLASTVVRQDGHQPRRSGAQGSQKVWPQVWRRVGWESTLEHWGHCRNLRRGFSWKVKCKDILVRLRKGKVKGGQVPVFMERVVCICIWGGGASVEELAVAALGDFLRGEEAFVFLLEVVALVLEPEVDHVGEEGEDDQEADVLIPLDLDHLVGESFPPHF